ncbi:Alpha/Beta hydrolase protein [Fusarium redolens]|uniref:Alpha/Beta hydrolase protein n=1 Tax=Fusarium redolens TaxID=48865 RepID=A0A9P9JTI0_FUSRE|nr:Alpha/Beta hydrolase protein [Fusarium redolens]KAH7231615.1 Alpha/Beta hydrolase protein [Fusarium redolens]
MGKLHSRWPWNRSSPSIDHVPPTANSTSPGQSSTPIFLHGVEVLHDCPDANIDICFVHGLTGNRRSTWTARGQSVPWPKTLLPSELSKACILTYGYNAYVVSKSVTSTNRLIDHATDLLVDLTNDRRRRNTLSRPLIFVAHGLGGLVCKEAILLSQNNPNRTLQDLFTHIRGIVFIGTPHKGSWMADWARIPAAALGIVKSTNKSLLKILEPDDKFLESINIRFLAMMRGQRKEGRQLEVACFFEELPLPIVGKVVSKESATFEGYDPIAIHANHIDMARFRSAEEYGFKMLIKKLTAWGSEIGKENKQLL